MNDRGTNLEKVSPSSGQPHNLLLELPLQHHQPGNPLVKHAPRHGPAKYPPRSCDSRSRHLASAGASTVLPRSRLLNSSSLSPLSSSCSRYAANRSWAISFVFSFSRIIASASPAFRSVDRSIRCYSACVSRLRSSVALCSSTCSLSQSHPDSSSSYSSTSSSSATFWFPESHSCPSHCTSCASARTFSSTSHLPSSPLGGPPPRTPAHPSP